MRRSVGRSATTALRVAALLAFLLAVVPATHFHVDRLDSPSACASCAFAQTRSAATTVAPVPALFLLVGLVVAPPRTIARRRATGRPVGRAPPSASQLVI
jgi:hypothetical protein